MDKLEEFITDQMLIAKKRTQEALVRDVLNLLQNEVLRLYSNYNSPFYVEEAEAVNRAKLKLETFFENEYGVKV